MKSVLPGVSWLLLLLHLPSAGAVDLLQEWLATLNRISEQTLLSVDADGVLEFMDGVSSLTTHLPHDGNSMNRTIYTFGFSDYANQIPVSESSHFPIGSNTKLYTAVAIYQLQEEGKLNVKDDIATMLDHQDFVNFGLPHRRRLCPRLPYHWGCEKITLENLLSMSSGIYPQLNCNAPSSSSTQCNPIPYIINSGSIGLTVGTFLTEPLIFRPGTQYHYSNPNFVLAAYFVEKYSGMTFRDYLNTRIFSRIGLKETYYDFFNQALRMDPKRVLQYLKYYDNETGELLSVGADVVQLDLGVASGTGGVLSTVHDQVSFWYALFNKTTQGAPLVSPVSQKAILAPHTLIQQSKLVWQNESIPIWSYYTQGTVVMCTEEGCPSGPRWIVYAGGTYTVHTANIMDYQNYAMSQVWTSTVVMKTSRESFEATEKGQTGAFFHLVKDWLNTDLPNVSVLAMLQLFDANPPIAPSKEVKSIQNSIVKSTN